IECYTNFGDLSSWMKSKGYDKEAAHCLRMSEKLKSGGRIMRRGVEVPKGYIGSFVSNKPTAITHPVQDRFLSYRECMTIMGLPSDFELLSPKKNLNHVCQNVPLQTARTMGYEVKAALEGQRQWVTTNSIYFQ